MNRIQRKIYQDLIGQILSGRLTPGSLLPGERELAVDYGTNTMNAKAAVNLLAHRGLAERKRHAGTRINPAAFPSLLNCLETAGDKLVILLTSRNPTGIHWDESTCRAFGTRAAKLGFSVIRLEMPVGNDNLKAFLTALARLQPEGMAVMDDNFDHETLFHLRDCFNLFPCPVARLNRLGASVPLNTPNTISADIDHYENGRLAGSAALSAGLPAAVLNSEIESKPINPNHHFFDKLDGIHDVFRAAGKPLPRQLDWSDESLRKLAGLIQCGQIRIILALNLEIAARGYDFLRRKNLKCPQDYRILGIDDLHQYRQYQFSTIAVSKSVVGTLLADLACRRLPPWLRNAGLSIRCSGRLLRRKTF